MNDTCSLSIKDCREAKPNSSFQNLRHWIKKCGTRKFANEGEKITCANKRAIIFVESGAWQMTVGDHKTINIICAGGLAWLDNSNLKNIKDLVQYNIIESTMYFELPICSSSLAMLDPQVFENVFDFVSLNSREISSKWLSQCTNDSYKKIKASLEWIYSLPPSIRSKFTLIFFISTTTGVSRSHALAIIKSLKEGDYIEIDRGYLVSIKSKLPSSY